MREHHTDHQADEQSDHRTARPTGSRATGPVESDHTAEFWGDAPRWNAGRSIPSDRRSGATPRLRGLAAGLTGSLPVIGGVRRDASGPVARLRPDATGQIPRTRRHGERAAHPAGSASLPGSVYQPPSSAMSLAPAASVSDDAIASLVRDAIARDEAAESARVDGTTAVPSTVFDDVDTDDALEPTGPVPVARIERTPRRRDERMGASFGAVDPLLVRLGVIVAVGVLLVPLALAFRSSTDEATVRTPSAVASGGPSLGRDRAVAVEPGALTGSVSGGDGSPGVDGAAAGTNGAGSDGSVTAAQAPTPTTEPCTLTYEVHEGDYWIRLADESGVRLADLLARNGATVETPLYPGGEVCLPAGATVPAPPPTTTVPPTTVAPVTTSAPSGSSSASGSSSGSSSSDSGSSTNRQASSQPAPTPPPATVPPTTVPPTTAAPRPRASTETPEQVRAIIREIFPEDQHEMAIRVAQRESSFRPGAYNGHCCYGIFQIYWSVHRSWLSDLGITSSAHLLDARANIQAAYVLYQRAGGWGPWRQTAY